jgi:hypothetical protein
VVDVVATTSWLTPGAVDSAISTDVLVGAVGVRPWPDSTTAHMLSIVADMDVPEEMWREKGYGKRASRT